MQAANNLTSALTPAWIPDEPHVRDYFCCIALGRSIPSKISEAVELMHIRSVDAVSRNPGCHWAESHTSWSNYDGEYNILFYAVWESLEHHARYFSSAFSIAHLNAASNIVAAEDSIIPSKWILKVNPILANRVYPFSMEMAPSEKMSTRERLLDPNRSRGAFVVSNLTIPRAHLREKYLQFLWSSEVLTRQEPGCISFDVFVGYDEENFDFFMILLYFRNKNDFQNHMTTPYSMFRDEGLAFLEREPDITYWKREDLP